jgi:hypothetical protein
LKIISKLGESFLNPQIMISHVRKLYKFYQKIKKINPTELKYVNFLSVGYIILCRKIKIDDRKVC